jgi:hypothetical protein
MLAPPDLYAAATQGAKLAERHIRFARSLASSRIRLDSAEFTHVATEVEKNDCTVTKEVARTTASALLPFAKAYGSEFCRPWMKLWEGLNACDGDKPPEWCDDEEAVLVRLDLDGYFAGLAAALRESPSELERENIMDIVLVSLSPHVIGDFGDDPPNRWATEAAEAYLKSASFNQVTSMAERLQKTWVGLTPGVVSQLDQYVRRSHDLTLEQRNRLKNLSENPHSDE